MSEPSFSINYTAEMLASEACAVGNGLVYDSTLGRWRVATAANRTAAGASTQAIALYDYGNPSAILGPVAYQSSGVLAQAISGLPVIAPGTPQLARMSTTGFIERISSYTAGDDVVGYAYPDGRVALHLGIPWSLIQGSAGSVPRLNAFSTLAQTVVGDAPVIIDSADIAVGIALNTSTGIITIATTGTYLVAYGVAIIQGGSGATFAIRINGTGGPDRTFTSTNNSGLSVGDVVRVSNTSLIALTAGDTVEIVNFGVDASLSGFGNPTAWITMVKVA